VSDFSSGHVSSLCGELGKNAGGDVGNCAAAHGVVYERVFVREQE